LLAVAAWMRRSSICKDLVCRGFDINGSANQLMSPLGAAILDRNIGVVRWLLENGANPNLDIEDHSVLCLAARTGHVSVQAMLEAGVDPNKHCESCSWGCALSIAASNGDISSLESLIEAGADSNPKFANVLRHTPLRWIMVRVCTLRCENEKRKKKNIKTHKERHTKIHKKKQRVKLLFYYNY